MDGVRGGGLARITLVSGLVLGSIGLAIAWWATQPRPSFPLGVVLLLAAAGIAVIAGRRVGGLAGLIAAGLVSSRLLTGDPIGALRFADGATVGVGRWLQALGLLVAVTSAVVLVIRRDPSTVDGERRPADPAVRRARWARAAQIAGLLALSAIGAELLAAYDDSTGRPGRLLFSVVFFAGLYGAPPC